MQTKIEIKDKHIKEAEQILINGDSFDTEERIPFIKNLNSCDLLAVPGSGKTTALLAKLYCLGKQLPLPNGAGILILSHTNAAIEEIEKKLKKYVPRLFEYPNFVGTVQSFVNKFLANPACYQKYGCYILQNDNDIYEREAEKFFYSLKYSPKGVEPKNLKNKLVGRVNFGKDNLQWKEKEKNVLDFIKYFELDIVNRKILYNESSFYTYSGTSQNYYLELEQWKEKLFTKGILNYRDSFYLAEWYIENFSKIKSILQNRFKYVFIDEMQDLEKYQIEIIDKIFLNSNTVIQRIGDINQAIYNSGKKVKVTADWKPREPIFYLTGSNRLTKEIADIVNYFTLDRQEDENGNPRFVVNGLRDIGEKIPPHIILFDYESKNKLKQKFKELIKHYELYKTDEGKKYGFHIIGWNAKWDDGENHNDKLRLEDIFEEYKKESSSNKETYDSLSKYLQFFDQNKNTLSAARKTILNALIHILRIENKTHEATIRSKKVKKYFTKRELLKHIKENQNKDYEYFKHKIYEWSFNLAVKKDFEGVYNSIKDFIKSEFKDWFNLSIGPETQNFIGENFEKYILTSNQESSEIIAEHDDIKIKIGTVHSVKGQTHCATMYIETSYYSYETQKSYIKEALLKNEHNFDLNQDTDKRGKQAFKMMYVGFSRPTHLLCFAVLKKNVIDILEELKSSGWEIIDVTQNNNINLASDLK